MKAAARLNWLIRVIWGDWQTNELWQRIVKSSLACVICVIVAVLPQVVAVYGTNTFFLPLVAVFAHPGQRMAKVVESILLILFGSLIGLAWSLLGLYLSSIISNSHGSSTVRAVFWLVVVLVHGFIRSSTPRLFVAVWLLLVSSAPTLLGSATEVTLSSFTSIYYPILSGAAIVFFVDLAIFPEVSTSFLGSSTIHTMSDSLDTVSRATYWFVSPGGDSAEARRKHSETVAKQKQQKKTWLRSFIAEFPNPFQTSNTSRPEPEPVHLTTLASLTERKAKLRAALAKCKTAQDEVNFEYAISPLPPQALKPISKRCLTSLIQNLVTLIGSCENKYVLLKTARDEEIAHDDTPSRVFSTDSIPAPAAPNILYRVSEDDGDGNGDPRSRIDDVKPLREIESGSADFLENVLRRLRPPVEEFGRSFEEATRLAMTCIAYCYDVPQLPFGAQQPSGLLVEELDLRIDSFADAITRFDQRSTEELKMVAMGEAGRNIDLMPRMEMFLVSSFLLGLRQAAAHVLQILRHARELVDQRGRRHDRSRLWLPHYTDLSRWLSTAGESDPMVLPENARKDVRTGKSTESAASTGSGETSTSEGSMPWQKKEDEENNAWGPQPEKASRPQKPLQKGPPKDTMQHASRMSHLRGLAADALEWAQHSDDLVYAVKLAIAVFVVSWPSFVTSWRDWYSQVRGIWAPLQLVLVFEVSIGTSLFIFFVRLFGVIAGCVTGYISYEIGQGNRIVMVVVLICGIIPSVYIQVATKYVKAGMISITSMSVVALAALNQSGSAYENFYKRFAAFLIGSMVAIVVEVVVYPVRARDRLLESLSASVRQVQNMHSAISVGADGPRRPNLQSKSLNSRFHQARDKAQASLAAAETFLPFCLNEPRLKGSFKPLEPIYQEIIYVLHQIIDRMGTVVELRKAYGSSILENLNPYVYAYRRNVAAANKLMLFSVHEALTTWLPLPQFIPSTRLAQLRLINRVREVLETNMPLDKAGQDDVVSEKNGVERTANFVTQRSFLAWNASAAGVVEIIEYLEELVELTKMLVGVNAFRSGLLERPRYKDYVEQAKSDRRALGELTASKSAPAVPSPGPGSPSGPAVEESLRRVATVAATMQRFAHRVRSRGQSLAPAAEPAPIPSTAQEEAVEDESDDEVLPMSLRRVGTRMTMDNTVVRRRGYSTATRMSR